MNQQDYEYQGLMASTWDLLRGDTSNWPDRAFFRNLILQHGQPALDVGCGTGRLLLDYLAEGIDIDGVDISPEMLALCQAKAQQLGLQPTLFQQAIEALELPRRYRTIIVPSSSFQLVTDLDMAKHALQRLYKHLEPGGLLAMPFMDLTQDYDSQPAQEWKLVVERVRPEDGAVVRRCSRGRYDSASQLEHTEDRYEVVQNGEVIATEHHQRSPATRSYTQEQAITLYRETGFTNIRVLSGFSHQPALEQDRLFTVVGTKP